MKEGNNGKSTITTAYPPITSTLTLNWPSHIVLVRHGESEGNKYGRKHMAQVIKKASYRYDLTPLGKEQAKHAREHLEREYGLDGFDAYFTSTYTRAQETFGVIFGGVRKNGHLVEPIIDARVNEITRGYASLYSEAELDSMFPHDRSSFRLNGWFHNIPLSGQSCVQIDHVIQTFLAYLRETCAGKKVVIVGHGTWINLFCRILRNRSVEEAEQLHAQGYYKNAGITVFERQSDGRLLQTAENIVPWEGKLEPSMEHKAP